MQLDVTDQNSVDQLAEDLIDQPVDSLINNAGIQPLMWTLADIELGPEDFICIALHPGWVQTDLGGPNAPLTVQESVQGMRRVIEDLLPADNGSFLTYDGKEMAW